MASIWTDQAVTAGNVKALTEAFTNISGKEDAEKRLTTSNGLSLIFLAIEAKQPKVNWF